MPDIHEDWPDERTGALARAMLDEVRTEVDRADQKASLLIGSLGIAFSIVLSGMLGGDWAPTLGTVGLTLWLLGAVLAILSVLAAALAVWPRMTKPPAGGAITFWGHVRSLGSAREVARALQQSGVHEPERTYQQLHVLSMVVQRKYRLIRWSMILAGLASLLVVLAFALVL